MTRNATIPTASTTLLELLSMGAEITFGSGRTLKGDVRNGYISVANEFGGLGLWDIDAKTGVDDAVSDLVRDAREHGLDLHGAEIPHPDDLSEEDGDDKHVD